MADDKLSDYVLLYFPLLLVFTIDRLTKSLAVSTLSQVEPLPFWNGLFSLSLTYNRGIAFGLLSAHGDIVVLCISIILLIGLLSIHNIPRRYYLPFGLILGGAFGNVFDRFIYSQGVVDFISVPHFSIFNVADIAITVGIIFLILSLFLSETRSAVRHKQKKNKSQKSAVKSAAKKTARRRA